MKELKFERKILYKIVFFHRFFLNIKIINYFIPNERDRESHLITLIDYVILGFFSCLDHNYNDFK